MILKFAPVTYQKQTCGSTMQFPYDWGCLLWFFQLLAIVSLLKLQPHSLTLPEKICFNDYITKSGNPIKTVNEHKTRVNAPKSALILREIDCIWFTKRLSALLKTTYITVTILGAIHNFGVLNNHTRCSAHSRHYTGTYFIIRISAVSHFLCIRV